MSLGVAVEALAAKDYMWELNYPFRIRPASSRCILRLDGDSEISVEGCRCMCHRGERGRRVREDERSNADPAAAENADYQTVSEYRKAVRDLVTLTQLLGLARVERGLREVH